MSGGVSIPDKLIDACCLLGVSAEILHGDSLTAYRYVQGSYLTLFTKIDDGQKWKEGILENCLRSGLDKRRAKRFAGQARERIYSVVIECRDALLDKIDPSRQSMDELLIEIEPPNDSQGELVVKVIIDGVIVPEEDYSLEVGTFFDSIVEGAGSEPKSVEFLGGCGYAECCGAGYYTQNCFLYWQWYQPGISFSEWSPPTARITDLKVAWTDVLAAADKIVAEFPRLSDAYPLKSNLPDYLAKIEILKKLVAQVS